MNNSKPSDRVDIGEFASALQVKRMENSTFMGEKRDDAQYKVSLVGDSGVGKSCILERAHHNKYNDGIASTIGVEFAAMRYTVTSPDGEIEKSVSLQVWDTAGQERYRAITAAYYRGTQAVIVVFSIDNEKSFASVDRWNQEVDDHTTKETPIKVLVGNKSDLRHARTVPAADIEQKAKQFHMLPFETSARENHNVANMLETIVRVLSQTLFDAPSGASKAGIALAGRAVPAPAQPISTATLRIVDPAAEPKARPASSACSC